MPSRIAGSPRLVRLLLVLLALIAVGCTGSDDPGPASPAPPAVASLEPTTEPTAQPGDPEPTVNAAPQTIDSQGFELVVALEAGTPVEDELGNLVTVHGLTIWPDSFADIGPFERDDVELFGGLEREWQDPGGLVALDIAVCAAGQEQQASAPLVDFFAATRTDAPVVDDDSTGAAAGRHPIISPGFTFPPPGDCARGWLPVGWSGEAEPTVARYLLTSAESGGAPRFLYQWDVTPSEPAASEQLFQVGEQVTFNDGPLADTTVSVAGWAELVGVESPVPGTRLVAVSLEICSAGPAPIAFGLAIDGWNLAEPVEGAAIPSPIDADGSTDGECRTGWLGFAVPLGGRPTGFFVTDQRDPLVGFAAWSLAGAALPVPQ